ncbi:hypothetical protein [Sulfurimonas sp.]|uniref:hypothetical protein n=1 Tax=Sulfurimonas sp. TaxID=2022749 RepID=UPI002B47B196|nr:hypothetical protein [Sulfurimonas sp.]
MIEIIEYGEEGITSWVNNLLNEIVKNPNEFIAMAKVNDGHDNYSLIVLFKNKCTIGKYTALIHEWGTNDGLSGEAGRGFIKINDFIEEKNIEDIEIELSEEDSKKIGYQSKKAFDWEKRKDIWKKYLSELKYKIE